MKNPYRARGTFIGRSYIDREADFKLQEAIIDNDRYPFFLAPRQSGKSSVLERARSLLATVDLRIIIIDLSVFSREELVDFNQFVLNFMTLICEELDVIEKLENRLQELKHETKFLLKSIRLLLQTISGRVVVCIDELDVLLTCTFKDDFLSQIRALFNIRARDSLFNRIPFIVAAAVSQDSLISDSKRSPFNVGARIVLSDFEKEQVNKLVAIGDWLDKEYVDHASDRILYWTNGSVFLSQNILEKVFWLKHEIAASLDICELIDHIVEEMVISAPREIHFSNIAKQLLEQPCLLSAWESWINDTVPNTEIRENLLLTGISSEQNPIRNRIYRRIFFVGGTLCLVPEASRLFKYDVFLSYSQKDKEFVLALAERMKKDGLRVWLDIWAIQPGESLSLKIQEGLEWSRTLLICMSPAYFESKWGKLEYQSLLFLDSTNTHRRLIPLLIEDCTKPDIIANLAYINWKTCSDEAYDKIFASCQEREETRRSEEKETEIKEILNYYNPSAIPDYPLKLKEFVTRNRAEELNRALMYLQGHRILLLTGIGGVGKTTIARALIDMKLSNVPIPFWFDFEQNKNAKVGDILEKLAAYMNCPDLAKFREEKQEAETKDIDKLIDKLQAGNPVWLIFDNLETILDDIYFHDEDMDLFFTRLHKSTHQAKIIITSRTFPKLKNGEDLIDVIEGEKQGIKGLKTSFAVDYLVKNGLADIEPDKLEELANGVDGHPLALKLLVELVKEYGAADTLSDLSMYQEQKEDTIKKARKLFDKLAGDEKELLERISVYREPIKMEDLKEMFAENTPKNAVKKLIDKSLLETDQKGNYWLHPLVQEFSYDDLKNKKEVHKLAMNYYISLSIPEKPAKKEDIQPLIEANHHACMAEEYNQAFNIIFDNNLNEYLDLWGNYTLLVDLYSKLLPKNLFGSEIFLKDKISSSVIFGNLGVAHTVLGETRKAIEYYEQALKIAREIGDRRSEGNWLGYLGNAYRDMGDAEKAIEYHEQALIIAREISDRRNEGAWLGNLGLAYSNLGETKKAIAYMEQALIIAREIGDRRNEGTWLGNLGLTYGNLGETKKAIAFLKKSLAIGKSIEDPRIIKLFEQKVKELERFNE